MRISELRRKSLNSGEDEKESKKNNNKERKKEIEYHKPSSKDLSIRMSNTTFRRGKEEGFDCREASAFWKKSCNNEDSLETEDD